MKSQPRLFFAAQPGQRVSASLKDAFAFELGLLVNGDLFPAENWHQSLSDRFFDPSMLETLLRAGSRIQASAVTMLLNRVRCDGDHWAIRTQGEPEGFYALLLAVRTALSEEGIIDVQGHTPHLTISYGARSRLDERAKIAPVEWTIDEVLLLEGGGNPYRYRIRGCWPLKQVFKPQLPLWD